MSSRPYLYGYPQSARFGDQRDNCSGPSRYLRICLHPTLPNANGHQAQRQLIAWPPAVTGSRVGFATVETAITRKAGLQAGPRPRPMLPDQHPSGRERPSGRHTSKLPRPEELFLSRLALDRHAADIANRRMLPRWPESKEFLVRDWQAAPPGRQKPAALDTFGASFIKIVARFIPPMKRRRVLLQLLAAFLF
jgi:hypothetical protein